MDSISKKKTVMMNGFMLRSKEADRARRMEKHLLHISPDWACGADLNRMLGYKVIDGTVSATTKSVVLRMYIYYNKDHPNGYTMEHKRFGTGDYFRIVKFE